MCGSPSCEQDVLNLYNHESNVDNDPSRNRGVNEVTVPCGKPPRLDLSSPPDALMSEQTGIDSILTFWMGISDVLPPLVVFPG